MVPEELGQIIPERAYDEGDQAAADNHEILVSRLLLHELNEQHGEAGDDADSVKEFEDVLWAGDHRREKKRKKEDCQKTRHSTAEASEKSGCVEVEEPGNRYEVVDG